MMEITTTAAPSQTPPVTTERLIAGGGQYLTFLLGGELYALGILSIKEIIDFGHLTEIPMMPDFVRGVINLRGSVVPVIDLLARFGKGNTQIAKRTAIVIVEAGDRLDGNSQYLGVMVDAVNEVLNIDRQHIEPPPTFGTGIRPDFISGMARRADRFVILLNVERVLSIDEMADLSKTLAAGSDHGGI